MSLARLFDRPYLLLILAVLFWSGNFILGRAVRAEVPPVGLAFWRWTLATVLLLPVAAGELRRDLGEIRRSMPVLAVLAFLGVATFNTLIYIGLQSTPALNAFLMQSTMPVLIVGLSFVLFGERLTRLQSLGVVLSLAGAVAIITEGSPGRLATLSLEPGDALVFLAVIFYAGYSTLLRLRPPIGALSFVTVTFALGAAVLLPFYLWETAAGRPVEPDAEALLSIGYVGIFPSILSFLFFNRGVELVGANRAGLFIHLMPVFGSILAVLLLGESLHPYHFMGMALILLGIGAATRPVGTVATGRGD